MYGVVQDRQDPNPTLTAEGLARYAMLGPSVHMSDAFFKRAQELEKPVHVWTVDTPSDLHRCACVLVLGGCSCTGAGVWG